jgi:single-strand DNA-binding protein
MSETTITVVGNITADPEYKIFPSGKAVANFTVASTPRRFDKATGQWADGDALFLRCNLWGDYAEHATESLTKGMQVMATGRLKQRSYDDREGVKRTIVELDIDDVGPTLRFATAKVVKATRNGGQAGGTQVQRSNGSAGADAWTSDAPQDDKPPF